MTQYQWIEVSIPVQIRADVLWSAVFGSGFETFPHWRQITFEHGTDWDNPGIVTMEVEDPDDELGMPLTFTVELKDIVKAWKDILATGAFSSTFTDPENWDASDADCVLQMATLGEVVYG